MDILQRITLYVEDRLQGYCLGPLGIVQTSNREIEKNRKFQLKKNIFSQ